MTKEEFLGTPELVETIPIVLSPRRLSAPLEPFLQYTAQISEDNCNVFHGDIFIAGFIRGNDKRCSTVYVHPEYRGQGIAEELIFTCISRYGGVTPARRRTYAGQRVYERVWERLNGLHTS